VNAPLGRRLVAESVGTGLLVSGQRRVWLDLYEKLSPAEYEAFHSDPVVAPVVVPIDARKRGVA